MPGNGRTPGRKADAIAGSLAQTLSWCAPDSQQGMPEWGVFPRFACLVETEKRKPEGEIHIIIFEYLDAFSAFPHLFAIPDMACHT